MYLLAKGTVFEDAKKCRWRLLRIEAGQDLAHVIALNDKNALPTQWSFRELSFGIDNGKFRPISVSTALVIEPLRDKKEKEKTAALRLLERRWSLIADIVDRPEILFRTGRWKFIESQAKSHNCSPITLALCIRLYFQGGMTKDALYPDFNLCGIQKPRALIGPPACRTPNGEPAAEKKVRGADRADKKAKFYVSPELGLAIWRFADQLLRSKTTTRKKIYREICKDQGWCYVNANGKVEFVPDTERASRRQVNYIINKHHSKIDELRRQCGPGEFENDYEPRTGHALLEALGIAHQYEMDSTIVDVYIVAKDNRNKILGKPTLYLIRDRYSRLIAGYYLTLDKPSWDGAKEAILSLVEDREARAKRLGVPWKPHLHPALGILPGEFILDRGSENMGHGSDRICSDVETTVVSLRAHFSSGKGIVECSFAQTHVPLKDNTAGYQPPEEAMRRHGDRSDEDATYTLDQLDAELYQIFEMLNEMSYPQMPQDPTSMLDGVPPVPVKVWEYDQKRSLGMMRRYDPKFLRMKLLPKKRGVVTGKGIRLNGMYYTCAHAEEQLWFHKAGQNVFPVQITYDRRLTDIVFVHDPADPRVYYEAQLTKGDAPFFGGKSHAEASVLVSIRRKNAKLALDANDQLRLQQEHDRAPRAANAKRLTDEAIAAAQGASRTSGVKQIQEDEKRSRRAQVKAQIRSAALEPAAPPAALPAPVAAAPAGNPQTAPTRSPLPKSGGGEAPSSAPSEAAAVVLSNPLASLFDLSSDD